MLIVSILKKLHLYMILGEELSLGGGEHFQRRRGGRCTFSWCMKFNCLCLYAILSIFIFTGFGVGNFNNAAKKGGLQRRKGGCKILDLLML